MTRFLIPPEELDRLQDALAANEITVSEFAVAVGMESLALLQQTLGFAAVKDKRLAGENDDGDVVRVA